MDSKSTKKKFEETEIYQILLVMMYMTNIMTGFLIVFALFLLTLPAPPL